MVRLGNDVSVGFWREGRARAYARLAGMGGWRRGDILLCILVEPECSWTVQWVSRLGADEISIRAERLHVRWAEGRHGALLGCWAAGRPAPETIVYLGNCR